MRNYRNFTEGSIIKSVLLFSLPIAFELLLQQLYNTFDVITVGRFIGKEALAAVGSTSYITNIFIGLCTGLASGASAVTAQSFGAQSREELSDTIRSAFYFSVIIGIIVSLCGVITVNPMLTLMNTPKNVIPGAKLYLSIYFIGILGSVVYSFNSGILRAIGDSIRPLILLVISAVLNITLDLLFVVFLKMGISGVAYATIIAQYFSAFLSSLILFLNFRKNHIKFGVVFNFPICKRIFKIGLPSGIQQSITSLSNVIVQSYVNFFGTVCMAGWASYTKIDIFIMIPISSMALTATTLVGQNYGAKNYDRMKDGIRTCLQIGVISSALMGFVFTIFANKLVLIFSPDISVNSYALYFIRILTPLYWLMSIYMILAASMRGMGKSQAPSLITIFSLVVIRQIILIINKNCLRNSLSGVILSFPIGWVICNLAMIWYYKHYATSINGID